MVTFNREIVANAGAVGYIEVVTSVADQLQSYPIGSSNITISGKTLTVTHPDKVFPANAEIYVYLEAGAVKAKTNGSILSPLVDKTNNAVSFFTGDVNPPVPTFSPDAYSVTKTYEPVESIITITFDEDIYNQHIELFFTKFIRDDIKFDSVEELLPQIENDKITAFEILKQL